MYSAKSLGRNQTYMFAEPDEDARVPRAPISAAGRARAMQVGSRRATPRRRALTSVLVAAPPLPRPAVAGHRHDRRRDGPAAATCRTPISIASASRRCSTTSARSPCPQEILEKPSALTSAEWRTVVQHPRIGQVILEQAAALKDAVPIILHHHERYAGHGYPFGLRGNDIPLGARIVAIADAYDAMTHDRPYKRGDVARGRDRASCAAMPGRSSTPSSSSCSATSTPTRRPRPTPCSR